LDAASLATLQADGHVKIKTWIEPQDHIIARQQVQLNIEIVSDNRFAAGTHIGHAEIEDAIVLQREKFAVNSSRREGEINWVVQQWELTVYPQRGGVFNVPAIALQLSIAGEPDDVAITGILYTKPLQFTAEVPDPLQSEEHDWVATNRFEVSDVFDRDIDSLKPGDAIVRSIRISADNLPAMMLPAIQPESIDGMAVYQKTPRLNDRSNRGDYVAERVDVLTYVFEKPGHYVLPARSYAWWNLETDGLESVELPEYALSVGGVLSGAETAAKDDMISLPHPWQILLIATLLLFLAGIMIVLWKQRQLHSSQPRHISRRDLLKQFEKACKRNQARQAVALFYQWLDYGDGQAHAATPYLKQFHQHELLDSFKQLMRTAYAPGSQNDSLQDDINLATFSDQLLCALNRKNRQRKSNRWRVHLSLDNH